MAKYIIAHDFGTSANKASLFTTEGKFVKTATAEYPTYYTNQSWVEQDPEDWWAAFCQTTKTLMQGIPKEDVLCVSFDGTYPNCCLLYTSIRICDTPSPIPCCFTVVKLFLLETPQ